MIITVTPEPRNTKWIKYLSLTLTGIKMEENDSESFLRKQIFYFLTNHLKTSWWNGGMTLSACGHRLPNSIPLYGVCLCREC